METHVMSMRDEGDSVYHSVVIAPDDATARRVFAMRMLSEYERTLAGSGEKSLDDYAPSSALEDDWRAEDSMNCISCGCGSTRQLEPREMASIGVSPMQNAGRAHVCLMCSSTWIATGQYGPLRERLETDAMSEIAALAEFERQSLLGDDDDDGADYGDSDGDEEDDRE